jgi:hypothetical protein
MVSFTLQEFLDLIAGYTTQFWPVGLVAYVLGVLVAIMAIRHAHNASKVVCGVLALVWLWVGVVFNGFYFTRLSSSAMVFAVLFVIEGILLAVIGVLRGDLSFNVKADVYGVIGGLVILYALVGYPAIGYLLGRGYPEALLLGLAPCPTTAFTLGILLWSDRPLPKLVLVVPILYAIGAGLIAAPRGIVEDFGLLALGIAVPIAILYRERMEARKLGLGTQSNA